MERSGSKQSSGSTDTEGEKGKQELMQEDPHGQEGPSSVTSWSVELVSLVKGRSGVSRKKTWSPKMGEGQQRSITGCPDH